MGFKNVFRKILSYRAVDLDSIDGINSLPNKQEILKYAKTGSLNGSILYDLQKRATIHKQNNRMDLSIACLEKAFNIMLNSDYFYGEYADRYIKYLKNDRQFDKARNVEKQLYNREKNTLSGIDEYIFAAQQLGTDLVEASYTNPCDADTAKYRGRVFSISGKDKRFPRLTQDVKNCDFELYPFVFGISEPCYCSNGHEIEFSNRPFMDDRSQEEKNEYNNIPTKIADSSVNEEEYYWIYEHIPEVAPKSLSGYVRMKNSNSKNYQNIVKLAKEKGFEIT